MTKRAFSLLFTLFLYAATTWGQSVVSKTATLDFQKKSGISGTTYRMEDVQPAAPFITEISTGYDYQSSDVSGKKKKYHITNGKAEFGYNADSEGYTLINMQFSNLIVGEKYTVTLTANTNTNNDGNMQVRNSWTGFIEYGTNPNDNKRPQPEWPEISGTSSKTITWTLTATQTEGSVSFAYNPSWNNKGLSTFTITKITISGKCKKMVTSSAGEKVCAGEPTTLTAVGLSGTIKWEKSIDNKATWQVIPGATSVTHTINVSEEAHYRASAGSDVVYTTNSIRPVVCCAADALVAEVLKESFSYSGTGRKKLSEINSNASTTYTYKSSGSIGDGYYAIVKKASDGGHWASNPVRTGHTKNGAQDGFLLVNAKPDPGIFFQYEVTTALCQNSYYDFSAWITNVTNTAGQAPVNATFRVMGYPSGKELVKTSTGNLGPGTDWTPKGGSFNSGTDTRFVLTIENNYEGSGTSVAGNDIGIDDILFSACSPEIQIYSNNDSQHKHEPEVVVCNAGANQNLTLDALASYDLKEFFTTPYYLFQTSNKATGPWRNVNTGATTQESITITVDPTNYRINPTTGEGGLYYRVWVGATAAAVEGSASTGTQNTGCGALTAVSDPIRIIYQCLCNPSTAPTANNYEACPASNLDLNTLITSTTTGGTIRWYNSETATTPMDAAAVSAVDVSATQAGTTRFYYVTYQKNDNATTGDKYCESKRTKVEVKVKAAISLTFDKDITTPISGCLANMTEADRTITITNASSINTTTSEILWNKGTRDASGAFVAGTELTKNATKYTLANAAETGTIRITAQYTGTTQNCPAVYYVDYNLSEAPAVNVDNVSTPCKQDLQTTGVTIKLKDISGNDKLSVYRSFDEGTTYSQLGTTITLPAGAATYEYKDTDFAHLAGSTDDILVKYKFILGDPTSNCKGEAFTDVYTISNTNRFELVVTGAEEVVDGTNIKYTVCEGTISPKLEIQTNYTLKEGENFLWYVKDLGQDDSQYQIPADIDQTLVAQINTGVFADELDRSIVVKAVIVAQPGYTTCGGEAIVTIYVDKKPEPSLASINPICLGNAATFTLSEGNAEVTAATYVLKEVGVTAAINNDLKVGVAYDHTPTTQGTHTYQVTATNGVCLSNSTTIEVVVASKPTFEAEADKDAICQGEDVTLTLKNYPAASTEYYWVDASSSNQQAVVTVNPTSVGKVTYVASVTAVCTDTMQVHVQVDAPINATIQPVSPICLGESTTLQVVGSEDYKYEWSPFNDCATPYKQNTVVTPSAAGEYTFVVAITTVNETCNDEQSVTLQVNDNPRIVHLDTCGIRQVMVEAEGGKAPYNYQIDKYPDLYFHGESGAVKFSEVPIGFHRMYITDDTGCSADSLFEIPAIPIKPEKYFTPNGIGDDKSELWTVEDLDENYTSYIVEIYDRYGRKLYEYRTGSFNVDGANSSEELGWDGTYNGHQMPSDDYWYLITVEEIRKQYTGHFTLKR